MSKYMEPIHFVTYDGVPLSDFGIYSSGRATFSSAGREYEVEEVPGRSGDLLFDKGRFKNIDVSYPSFIVENAVNNLEGIRNFLGSRRGYLRLEDTFNPDTYRMAYYTGGLPVEGANLNEAFGFEIVFHCKPQRFYKSGEIEVTLNQNGGINNPSYQPSSPIIRVYGYGEVHIGTYEVTVAQNNNPYVDIDCDLQECYCGTLNCNSLVTITDYKFPVLESGYNGIELGEHVSSIVITPRWWML